MPQTAPKRHSTIVPHHLTGVQRSTGHHVGRQLPPRKSSKTTTNRSPLRPVKISKPLLRAKHKSNKRLLWWGGLSRHEQLEYIKSHPRTKLQPTRKLARPPSGRPGQHSNKHANVQGVPNRPQVKPVTRRRQHWRYLHQLFGHLHNTLQNPEKTNKLVERVEARLNKSEHKLLDGAKDYAKAHPDLIKPPHAFRKTLLRAGVFILMAGVGGVVAGPAGIVLATHILNEWKNHGGDIATFGWNALRGKDLNGDDQHEPDEHERPVQLLIKSLKIQLDNSKNKADSERIRNIIEQLTDQIERYQDLKQGGQLGDLDLPTPQPAASKTRRRTRGKIRRKPG